MLEATRIDGASELRTFTSVVMPMIKPGIGALAIFTFISSWNDYFLQLIMLSKNVNYTISIGIATMQAENSTDFGLIMAGAALAAVPIILVFLLFPSFFSDHSIETETYVLMTVWSFLGLLFFSALLGLLFYGGIQRLDRILGFGQFVRKLLRVILPGCFFLGGYLQGGFGVL